MNTHGPVEPDKDNIRQEPYTLPQGFTWDALDLGDRAVVSTSSSAYVCWSVLVGSSGLGLLEMVLGMEGSPSAQQVTLWLCHTISWGLHGSDSPYCSSLLPIPDWAAWPGLFKGMSGCLKPRVLLLEDPLEYAPLLWKMTQGSPVSCCSPFSM